VENDVHVIGVSSQAGGHKTLVGALVAELGRLGGGNIKIVLGGVIPAQDHDHLYALGVSAIYGPGTHIPTAATEVIDIISRRPNSA